MSVLFTAIFSAGSIVRDRRIIIVALTDAAGVPYNAILFRTVIGELPLLSFTR